MPRPIKCRKVCRLPRVRAYHPEGGEAGRVTLTVDEYETVRLIDYQGFSQEECAAFMQVARQTAQQIYLSARKKLARALVEGMGLRIEGGQYRLCDGQEKACRCGGCPRHRNEKKEGKDHENCSDL